MQNMVVTEENKKKALAHVLAGHNFVQEKSYKLAMNEFFNAIACDPTLAKAYYNIGIVYTYENQNVEAESFFLQAKKLWERQDEQECISDCLNEISLIYYRRKDYQKAISDITEAISLNKNNYNLFRHRGEYYYGDKKIDFAILNFEEAIRLNNSDIKSRTYLGNCYYSRKEYDKAMVEYSNAIQIDPNASATCHHNLAKIYARNPNQIFNAISHYHWALRLKPTLAEAKKELEKCLEDKSKDDIFIGIKTLSKSKQFQLLTGLRDKKDPWAQLFWKWRLLEDELSSCSMESGILKQINDYLKEGPLFKMAAAVICRGFFKDKNNPPLPLDIVKVIFQKLPQGVMTEDTDEIVQERYDTSGFKRT